MNRLGILVFYDEKGIVDEYLNYYIQSLVQVITELVIVVNGVVSDSGLKVFEKYTKRIYLRENEGFDAGAYKDVFTNYISQDEWSKYDEIILTNDTCFGPFVPFREIFHEMSNREADFWGINYIERKQMPHLQSNFLVFKKMAIRDMVSYLKNKIPDDMQNLIEVVRRFEIGLFTYLIDLNYIFDSYAARGKINNYCSPDYAMIENGYPFLKKKAFDQSKYAGNRDNCIRALKYVYKSSNYDIQLIMDCIKRKYQTVFDLQEEFRNELITQRKEVGNLILDDAVLTQFLNSMDSIYIYGAGTWAKFLFRYYQKELKKLKGFLVSDDHYQLDHLFGHDVVKLSELTDLSAGIIVGLGEKNTEEVKGNLEKYRNVLYIWQ
ncbi:MAG: rhamnan synthesis F family protein [Eubacterium sp.]|nr:rhamnan synthesis F family protein [Eubacterium sp.]